MFDIQGARHHVRRKSPPLCFRRIASFSAKGHGELTKTVIVRPDGNPLEKAAQTAVADFGLGLELTTISNSSISFSDHWPFWEADYPSMLVIEEIDQTTHYPANPFYHTSDDRAYHLSESQMASMTKALLGAVLSLDAGSGQEVPSDLIVTSAVIVIVTSAMTVAIIIYIRERRRRET